LRTSSLAFGRRLPLALTVSSLLLATAASGSAATKVAAGTASSPATNAYGPVAVGVPNLNLPNAKRAGGVDLYLPNRKAQRVTEQKLGLVGSGKGDFHRFGAATIVDQLNGDKYPDLVVGAPGLAARGAKGKVVVLFGSAKGITAKGAQVLSPGEVGDEFGASMVLSGGVLYIGAPGHDSGGVGNAGGLYRYSLGAKGNATAIDLLTQSLPALGGVSQADQRFGEVLAPGGDGVVIGLPNALVGTAAGAGEMMMIHPGPTPAALTVETWSQDSPGVPDTAEAGDHFGAAVTAGGHAVGVPGEDVGSIVDAGAVQTFVWDTFVDANLQPYTFITQADPEVPGQAEPGDRFGAALASGIFDSMESISQAVGAPGEDVGTVTDAGSITLVGLPMVASDARYVGSSKLFQQGHGLPGTPEPGDALGASLATVMGNGGFEETSFDSILIGVPGEDVGTAKAHRNTGRAIIWNTSEYPTLSFGYSGGDLAGLKYGANLASESAH